MSTLPSVIVFQRLLWQAVWAQIRLPHRGQSDPVPYCLHAILSNENCCRQHQQKNKTLSVAFLTVNFLDTDWFVDLLLYSIGKVMLESVNISNSTTFTCFLILC